MATCAARRALFYEAFMKVFSIALALVLASGAAMAQPACGPDALGVARTLSLGVEGGAAIGLKSYPRTLPLGEREVVLTFDDGPDAHATPRILDALARECVKATFFMIGRNAAGLPQIARRERSEGHTVAYHSATHPAVTLRGLPQDKAEADILFGMEQVDRAVYGAAERGHPKSPFFRFPGFADSPALLDKLGRMNVVTLGTDVWASDWAPMSPQKQLDLVMSRLQQAGRGVVLFHDTKKQTADMLPAFLRELKRRGWRVVHIVPGRGPAETIAAAPGWRSETEGILAKMGYRTGAARPARSETGLPMRPAQ